MSLGELHLTYQVIGHVQKYDFDPGEEKALAVFCSETGSDLTYI